MLSSKLEALIAHPQSRHLYRQRVVGNEELINFSCNDYLSLAHHPEVKKAYQQGYDKYPTGSGGSAVVCGYHQAHQEVEAAFSQALKVEDCLLLSSGYVANLSVCALIAQLQTRVLIDKQVHASIYDGLHHYKINYSRYKHNDIADATRKLQEITSDTVIMTESLFSMSGQLAPLNALAELATAKEGALIVDEAHAFGVIGEEGMGAVTSIPSACIPLRIIPLGKAFAAQGAIIAGERLWINALIQHARPYVYSTAISPALCEGMRFVLEKIRQSHSRRDKLTALIRYFRERTRASTLTWNDSISAIQQLQLGCAKKALKLSEGLKKRGFLCMAVRPPTVTKKETGLRVILNYHHQTRQIDRFINTVEQLCQSI